MIYNVYVSIYIYIYMYLFLNEIEDFEGDSLQHLKVKVCSTSSSGVLCATWQDGPLHPG